MSGGATGWTPSQGLALAAAAMGFLASWAIMDQRSEPEVAWEITSFLKLQLSPAMLNTGNSVALESHLGTCSPAVSFGVLFPYLDCHFLMHKGASDPSLRFVGSEGEGVPA